MCTDFFADASFRRCICLGTLEAFHTEMLPLQGHNQAGMCSKEPAGPFSIRLGGTYT